MEFKDLVEQIAAKVAQRISEMEEKTAISTPVYNEISQKPKLLIISEAHGSACHELWENESVNHKYDVVCALNSEYQCDVQQFDVVVLRNLSITSLGKITEGIGDTPFTELVIKAILSGKKIIIPNEELEVFQYRETAPKLYYGMMMQKIELLKNVGVCFCSVEQLENVLLDNEYVQDKKNCSAVEEQQSSCVSEASPKITIKKRVITERDIQSTYEQHAKLISITEKTIITDLAREYANQKGISFIIG